MITTDLGTVFRSNESLTRLANVQNLRSRVSYKIGKIVLGISKEVDAVGKVRESLFAKYGAKTLSEDGQEILQVPPEKLDEFRSELEELLQETIELPYDKIKLSYIEAAHGLTPLDFIKLDYLIEDDVKEA